MKTCAGRFVTYFMYLKASLGVIALILLIIDFVFYYDKPDSRVEVLIESYLLSEWGIDIDLTILHKQDELTEKSK